MSEKGTPHIHAALISRAKKNDRVAQSQLYSLYYKAIYNSSLRIVGDAFIAEDIMQDSFLDGFKNLSKVQDSSTFGAWLKKIAINKSINYLRREQLIADKLEDYSKIENEELEDVGNEQYSIADVKNALSQLATNYKTVFSLYMIEGYDHEEIAEIMNISSSTSRSQLSRAKQQIKKIIQQKTVELI